MNKEEVATCLDQLIALIKNDYSRRKTLKSLRNLKSSLENDDEAVKISSG